MRNQQHLMRRSPTAQKLSLDSFTFLGPQTIQGVRASQSVALMGEALNIFQAEFCKQ